MSCELDPSVSFDAILEPSPLVRKALPGGLCLTPLLFISIWIQEISRPFGSRFSPHGYLEPGAFSFQST
jgi:hypothetical protein